MSEVVTFPPALERFASVEEFYEADERRRFSGEADYGIWWYDGPQGYSESWRVSAVAATGEIYAVQLSRNMRRGSGDRGRVVLLGQLAPDDHGDPGYVIADRVLEGWNLECGKDSSLQWAVDRVLAAVGEYPAPVSILLRHQSIGAHVHVDVFVGRQKGSRGHAGELMLRDEEWSILRDGFTRGFGDRLELVEVAAVAPTEQAG